jgi:ribosomal protein S12
MDRRGPNSVLRKAVRRDLLQRIVTTFSIKNKHSLTVEVRYSGQQHGVV